MNKLLLCFSLFFSSGIIFAMDEENSNYKIDDHKVPSAVRNSSWFIGCAREFDALSCNRYTFYRLYGKDRSPASSPE